MLAVEREIFLGAGTGQIGCEATVETGSAGHEADGLTVRMQWTIGPILGGHREAMRDDRGDKAVVESLVLLNPRESAA